MLTSTQWVTQLSTHHRSISISPGVITHSTPQVVHADLHSAFIGNVASCQSYLTVCTWSCKWNIKSWKSCGCLLYQIIKLHYIPSHPTPASAEWRQLCDMIGLLWHSSSWLALEVHWTSSRKIGPLPVPKFALLYALPPGHQYNKSIWQ